MKPIRLDQRWTDNASHEDSAMSITSSNPMPYSSTDPTGLAIRRVSWGAIFVGAVLAAALMVLFSILGLAIGFGVVDPATEADPLAGLATATAIYFIVTQLISLGVGGFAEARLAGVPRATTAALHGASVWAVTTLVTAWLAISGAGMLLGAGANALTALVNTTTDAVEYVVPDDMSFPDISDLAANISIEDLPQPLQSRLEEENITIAQLQRDLTAAFREVVSTDEQTRAMELLRSTAMDALRTPGDISADINAALDRLVGGEQAIFSAEDREEVLIVLERRLGLTPAEVEQIVQTVEAGVDTAIEAVGILATFELCQEIVAAGGIIANIGVHGKPADLHLETLWDRNIAITTRLVDTATIPMLFKTAAAKTIDPALLISHRFTLAEGEAAYETFGDAAKSKALKVIISPA
jgi:hypothetical protein